MNNQVSLQREEAFTSRPGITEEIRQLNKGADLLDRIENGDFEGAEASRMLGAVRNRIALSKESTRLRATAGRLIAAESRLINHETPRERA